jgi:hypothetical protein
MMTLVQAYNDPCAKAYDDPCASTMTLVQKPAMTLVQAYNDPYASLQ